jgi:hypothetical protein
MISCKSWLDEDVRCTGCDGGLTGSKPREQFPGLSLILVSIRGRPSGVSVSVPSDYFSSLRAGDLCRSIHSICSASTSQPPATSSNALFMDGLFAFAALCLASAAFCRYMSARNDIQGKRQMDKAVPSACPPIPMALADLPTQRAGGGCPRSLARPAAR